MSTRVPSTPVPSGPVPLRWRGGALVAALGLALAACGDGDEAEATPDPVDGDTIEVSMVDFAFVGLPETTAAGTRLTVVNDAEEELHEVVAFRLPDDEDRAVDELAGLAPGELVQALGEPVTVLLAEPGGEQIPAVGDGTLAEPGRYALMCFIPTGVDPQEYLRVAAETEEGPPQVEGGPPHFVHGMYAEITVE
jgi:hypothetical protein